MGAELNFKKMIDSSYYQSTATDRKEQMEQTIASVSMHEFHFRLQEIALSQVEFNDLPLHQKYVIIHNLRIREKKRCSPSETCHSLFSQMPSDEKSSNSINKSIRNLFSTTKLNPELFNEVCDFYRGLPIKYQPTKTIPVDLGDFIDATVYSCNHPNLSLFSFIHPESVSPKEVVMLLQASTISNIAENIHKLPINKMGHAQIAAEIVESSPRTLMTNIQRFTYLDAKAREEYCTVLTRRLPNDMPLHIDKFFIEDEEVLFELALKMGRLAVAANIEKFCFKDEEKRFQIALRAIEMGFGDTVSKNFDNFGITDNDKLSHIASIIFPRDLEKEMTFRSKFLIANPIETL